jgi:two-component system LytT family response regulator
MSHVVAPYYKVLIADDESLARRRLMQFLANEMDVKVVAECKNGHEASVEIARLQPDIVFLDIEMPECSGLDVVSKIASGLIPVTIFVTAFDQYALPAFDANATDYLLKPFDQERFSRCMSKARKMLMHNKSALPIITNNLLEMMTVPSGDSKKVIKTDEILYIGAEGNYIRLHTLQGQFQLRERMQGILERLNPNMFRRIHRSHIINVNHIKKFLPWYGGDYLVMMADGSRLTLSRNFRDSLQDLL